MLCLSHSSSNNSMFSILHWMLDEHVRYEVCPVTPSVPFRHNCWCGRDNKTQGAYNNKVCGAQAINIYLILREVLPM